MGKEYNIQQDLSRILFELDNKMTELRSGDRDFSRIFGGEGEDSQIRSFVQKKLGVYGGAFGIAEGLKDRFSLLQRSAYPPYEGTPVIELPYAEGISTKDGALIDMLFMRRRGAQKLSGITRRRGVPISATPEFYLNLPRPGGEPGQPHSNSLQNQHPKSLSPIPFERECRKSPGFKFLYCTPGEVSFFLYAWRWLLRYCQKVGGKVAASPVRDLAMKRRRADIWQEGFWGPFKGAVPMELEWIREIDDIERNAKGADTDRGRFLSDVIKSWKEARKIDNGEPTDYPYEEWENLGLLKAENASMKLLALIRFAHHALIDCEDKAKADSDEKLVEHIKETRESIERAKMKITTSSSWDYIQSLGLDTTLQQIVNFTLTRWTRRRSVFELLAELHETARFPIIPYFYWTKLDTDRTRPKGHLVFNVWLSDRFPIDINIPKLVKKDGTTKTEFILEKSGAVVVCLLGVRPTWGDNGEMPEYESGESCKKIYQHLYRVSTFFDHLARPIVDQGFYGGTVDESRQREIESEQRARILSAQNNKERSIAHILKRLFSRLNHFLTSGYLVSGHEKNEYNRVLLKIISKYLSFSFEWRHHMSDMLIEGHPKVEQEPSDLMNSISIQDDELKYVDCVTFMKVLLIHVACVHDMEIEEKVDIGTLQSIGEYIRCMVDQFQDEPEPRFSKDDFALFFPEPDEMQEFLGKLGSIRIIDRSSVNVELNISCVKEKFYTLMIQFYEFVYNALKEGDERIILQVYQQDDHNYLMFSNQDLLQEPDNAFIRNFSAVDLSEELQGFGLRCFNDYLRDHSCALMIYRDGDNFIRMIKVGKASDLFRFGGGK